MEGADEVNLVFAWENYYGNGSYGLFLEGSARAPGAECV
jgi:hypothetical protein